MTSCDLSSLSPYFRDLSTVTVSLKVIYVFSIAQFREDELDHVSEWVQRNNLKLNRTKSVEIVFEDRWRKSLAQYSPTLLDIQRATQIKILGITVTDHLSISEHVRDVICKCGQSPYAIKVLRSHGMCVDALKDIYRPVVLAKLLYASPAWWGFATTSDKQRIEAFVRQCSARLIWQQWPYSDPACWGRRQKTVQKHQVQRTLRPTTVSSRTISQWYNAVYPVTRRLDRWYLPSC